MKRNIIILVILFGVVVALISYVLSMNASRGDEMAELTLVLSLDKTTYRSGEPIQASVTLQNTGGKSLMVRRRMVVSQPVAPDGLRELVFRIDSQWGEVTAVFYPHYIDTTRKDFVILAPHETIERVVDIQDQYNLTRSGRYSVSAVYKNISDPPGFLQKEAWKGEITSNVVEFEITE